MINKVWLKSFRNLDETIIELEPDKTLFIYGDNNQGKTNVLEALFFISNIKSPKTTTIQEIIRFKEDVVYMGADIKNSDSNDSKLYIKMTLDGKREVTIDNEPIKRISKLQNKLPVEYICADIIRVFQGYPEARRHALDKLIEKVEPLYKSQLTRYKECIKQKQNLLKQNADSETIKLWNKVLVEHANYIVTHRLNALEHIQKTFSTICQEITPLKGKPVSFSYKTNHIHRHPEGYSKALEEKLSTNINKEKHAGSCLYGPHRDDFDVYINNISLFTFYSKGINRVCALLFKLSQIILMKNEKNECPLILLDDTLAEIDMTLKKECIRIIEQHCQIVYASTERSESTLFRRVKSVCIQRGQLVYEDNN